MIAMVRAALGALPMPAFRRRHDAPSRLATARSRAVLLAPVAAPADRQRHPAQRANDGSVAGHALASADFLPLALVSGEGAWVDAPSRDTEGRELLLPAFVLSALVLLS